MHNPRNPLGPPVRNRPADDKRPTVSSTLGMATVNTTNAWKPPRAYDNPYAHQSYRPPPIDTKGSGWRNPSSARPTEAGIIPSFRQALRSFLPAQDSLPLSAIQSTQRRNLRPSMPSIPTQIPDNVLPDVATVRFVLLCALWYSSSALSSNTGKSLMMQFKYPITLTFVQFGFVAAYCLLFMSPIVRFSRLRRPTRAILKDTLPMGLFQVGGHIFSSMAISRISVSTVHTIKALSPLFTVAAYALLFGVRYSSQTYISLLPLTLGVMLACSFEVSASNLTGLLCAFGSALVFVTSNIFFKKIMPTNTGSSASGGSHAHKLDKLNLLFYSSSMAFLLMIPIWLTTDLPAFLALSANPSHIAHPSHAHEATHGVKTYFFANGTVHFAQNIIAFVILASVSPVTYSIASLVKRVAVICLAIVWFSQRVYPVQALGIALTFFGLYLYHGAKSDVERGEKARRGVEAIRDGALPLTREEEKEFALARSQPSPVPSPAELQMNFAPDVIGLGIPAHEAYSTQAQMISPVMAKDAFHRGAPGLHIDTLPRRGGAQDPYPSPPASIDSPPLTAQLVPPVRS